MSIDIKFGSTTIPGVRKWSESLKNRIKKTTIPRRHGALIDDYPVLGTRTINLAGIIVEDTATALRNTLDSLDATLNAGKNALYLHDDRYISCVKSSFKVDYVKGFVGRAIKYTLQFVAEDPFWYATSETTVSNSSTISANTETNLSINASTGNAPSHCLITATPDSATMTSLKIYNANTNIDKYWLYEGSVSTSGIVKINSDDRTVILNSTSDLANFTGDFWDIQCGETNTLSVLSDADIAAGDLNITWTPRWY